MKKTVRVASEILKSNYQELGYFIQFAILAVIGYWSVIFNLVELLDLFYMVLMAPVLVLVVGCLGDIATGGTSKQHEAAEEELERQFLTFCEPGLEMLPEDRREEFRRRLLDTCDYYSEKKSLRQRLDEWWWSVNVGGKHGSR